MKDNKNFIADIIIPHYDRDDLLEKCLEKIPKKEFNVIVESNGTFAQNCNRGAKKAKTENLIFLNDDVLVNQEILDKILKPKSDIVGVAQKIPNIDGMIYGLGIKLSDKKNGTERFFAKRASEVFFPSGFFFKINRDSWERLNGFNENFRNGCEDSDLFLRAIETGMSFDYVEDSVIHLHSQSSGRNDNDDNNSILLNKLWNRDRINNLIESSSYIFLKNNILFWLDRDDIYKNFFVAEDKCPYCGKIGVDKNHISNCGKDAPLISVIIPSRVDDDVLSIKYLKKQTYKNIEIIVEYDKKQEGASVARNRGKEKAKGEYLFFCDNDLILNPNCLSDLYLALKKSKEAKWVFGKFYINGDLFNENKDLNIPKDKKSVEWINYFQGISTMSLIEANVNPVFDEEQKRYNDWDLWLSLDKAGFKPAFCNKILFCTRIKPRDISSSSLLEGRKWKNRLYYKYEIDVESKINELKEKNTSLNLKLEKIKLNLKIQKDLNKIIKSSKFWVVRNLYMNFKHYFILIFLNPKKFVRKIIARVNNYYFRKNKIKKTNDIFIKNNFEENKVNYDISNKKISVVMLTLNRLDDTKRSIDALFKSIPINFELIILDNGSDIEMVNFLKNIRKKYKNIKVIFEKENIGCAGGRNKAFSLATGDYVFSIDNDIVITKYTVENLIKTLDKHSNCVGVCCKVVFPDGKIQYNGGGYSIDENVFIKFSFIDSGKEFYDPSSYEQKECDWIPGGATMWKKSVLDKLNIDPDMMGAYEDNDFCIRLKKEGYKFYNCPRALVLHNHIYFKPLFFLEKKYMNNRYNNQRITNSIARFYSKHNLIIIDSYLSKIGLDLEDTDEILDYFNDKLNETNS